MLGAAPLGSAPLGSLADAPEGWRTLEDGSPRITEASDGRITEGFTVEDLASDITATSAATFLGLRIRRGETSLTAIGSKLDAAEKTVFGAFDSDVSEEQRVTEDGDSRVTQAGDGRVTEIGSCALSGTAQVTLGAYADFSTLSSQTSQAGRVNKSEVSLVASGSFLGALKGIIRVASDVTATSVVSFTGRADYNGETSLTASGSQLDAAEKTVFGAFDSDVSEEQRVTEDGDSRVTQAGDGRVTEIGSCALTGVAQVTLGTYVDFSTLSSQTSQAGKIGRPEVSLVASGSFSTSIKEITRVELSLGVHQERRTEAGDSRVTEAGDGRVTEDVGADLNATANAIRRPSGSLTTSAGIVSVAGLVGQTSSSLSASTGIVSLAIRAYPAVSLVSGTSSLSATGRRTHAWFGVYEAVDEEYTRATENGDTRQTESGSDTRSIRFVQNKAEGSILGDPTRILFSGDMYVKDDSTWKDSEVFVKWQGTWDRPEAVYKHTNGAWKRVY